jgi:hypothetical protein
MIRKTRKHLVQNEGLLFEESSPGKASIAGARRARGRCGGGAGRHVRNEIEGFPVSEVEAIRPSRLSTYNYAIDLGMYPLTVHDEVQWG